MEFYNSIHFWWLKIYTGSFGFAEIKIVLYWQWRKTFDLRSWFVFFCSHYVEQFIVHFFLSMSHKKIRQATYHKAASVLYYVQINIHTRDPRLSRLSWSHAVNLSTKPTPASAILVPTLNVCFRVLAILMPAVSFNILFRFSPIYIFLFLLFCLTRYVAFGYLTRPGACFSLPRLLSPATTCSTKNSEPKDGH